MVVQFDRLTFQQLNRAAAIQAKIEALQRELDSVLGGSASVSPRTAKPATTSRRKRILSAEGKARIIAAQKARWAKVRAAKKAATKASARG